MSMEKKLATRTKRRTFRVKNRLKNDSQNHRIMVYRSLKNIYVQIIDDRTHHTLVSFSTAKLTERVGDKKAQAKAVGLALGRQALEQSITNVFFDRGRYKYHGRVAALADGLRESGLQF